MFSFFKYSLQKIYNNVTSAFQVLFSYQTIDQEVLTEVEKILITADAGPAFTRSVIKKLQSEYDAGTLKTGQQLEIALKQILRSAMLPRKTQQGNIFVLVGVNGSGKTTCAGKLAHFFTSGGKRVLLVAADTFRAAAVEQLTIWAARADVEIITGKHNQDPASVVYAGCQRFKEGNFDILIVDTAGRLQTSIPLMKELEKVMRTIQKSLPDHVLEKLLIIDGMLGRNSFDQATLFHQTLQLDGIILSKMDGTGKGGIVFAINQDLRIPIVYLAAGESIEHLQLFDSQAYVDVLFSK